MVTKPELGIAEPLVTTKPAALEFIVATPPVHRARWADHDIYDIYEADDAIWAAPPS